MEGQNSNDLVVDGVFVTLGGTPILQGIYLKASPGRVCVLFGENGSGKSTILKVAAGQLQPDSGIVSIRGIRFHSVRQRGRYAAMAYLPQDSMLPEDMSVHALLKYSGGWERLQNDPMISGIRDQKVGMLSGGERRYVELCLVLSLERLFYLLDEPFTGVEPRLIELMVERIQDRATAGAGIVLTDHYKHYAVPLAQDAYLMRQKQCKQLDPDGDIAEQLARYGYLSAKQW